MKQNWTYKKLGDYIKEYNVKNKSNESISVYSVTNSQGFCKEYFSKEVASKDKTTYKIVPYGCFAYNPSRINVGSIDWQHEEEQVIVSPLYNVFSISKDIMQEYLLYYLKSANTMAYINAIATGTVRANLKMSMLKDFVLPLPPLSTQQSIVAELDEINNLLSLKRKELDAYDKLAQSLFYEMFGDPVENEKGWEVKKLGEVCEIIPGFAFPSDSFIENGETKVVKITNVGVNEFIEDSSSLSSQYKDFEGFHLSYGDIVIALTRTIISTGIKVTIVPQTYDNALLNQRVAAIKPMLKYCSRQYINAIIMSEYSKHYISEKARALMQPNLSIKDLRDFPIPLPPLSLQQTFATRIEAIEEQKANVKAAIEKLETLLAARMQYWFE